jgi:hypothetical protein
MNLATGFSTGRKAKNLIRLHTIKRTRMGGGGLKQKLMLWGQLVTRSKKPGWALYAYLHGVAGHCMLIYTEWLGIVCLFTWSGWALYAYLHGVAGHCMLIYTEWLGIGCLVTRSKKPGCTVKKC